MSFQPSTASYSPRDDLAVAPAPPISSDSSILASGSISVEALNRAIDLREVIAQCESGAVGNIRKLYGPEKGRLTNPMWANIKVTITRRERLFLELQTEFNGDKAKFFSFFTTDNTATGKKRKATETTEKLRPLRLVVEAIPHRDKDLAAEKMREHYRENNLFSEDLWATKWDAMNKWEIWRAIGKEKY
jgi:hypothetical protein